jgi:hypothetical protein
MQIEITFNYNNPIYTVSGASDGDLRVGAQDSFGT